MGICLADRPRRTTSLVWAGPAPLKQAERILSHPRRNRPFVSHMRRPEREGQDLRSHARPCSTEDQKGLATLRRA